MSPSQEDAPHAKSAESAHLADNKSQCQNNCEFYVNVGAINYSFAIFLNVGE